MEVELEGGRAGVDGGNGGCDVAVIRYMFEYVYTLNNNMNISLKSPVYTVLNNRA